MHNRGFFATSRLPLLATMLLWLGAALPLRAADALQVDMLLVSPSGPEYASHRNGAVLGQTEGNIQGRFLGIEYRLRQVDLDTALRETDAVSAVIVAGSIDQLHALQRVYSPLRVPVFNIALADMSLRESCTPGLYHTPPSEKMLEDAEAQWRQTHPGAEVRALAWHPDFVKFAGRDLNKRYTEQFGVPMDSDAWAGWAATRMLAEAVVRTGDDAPAGLDAYLREELAFDGQKGVGQSFRDNGQLRQPLLLVNGAGELLGEAPVRGVADSNDLDSLGLPGCR